MYKDYSNTGCNGLKKAMKSSCFPGFSIEQ